MPGDNLHPRIPDGGGMVFCDDSATGVPFVASVPAADYPVLCFLCLHIPFP
ncbi:hypothetical protein A2U01_0100880 [Trifolium medium]|uniref:Uncharacterized protein n=1 Tax=Trifolium medium TaxID=97028 RepID=A0A392UX78_9FABA|nr:hypothetical protein [Trifolium medium]